MEKLICGLLEWVNMKDGRSILFLVFPWFVCDQIFGPKLAGVKCACYDITRKSWRKCQVRGFRWKNSDKCIFKCVESLFPVGKRMPIKKLKLDDFVELFMTSYAQQ
ncbi:hypothetical protein P3L10_024088 [Capsicum annuum]